MHEIDVSLVFASPEHQWLYETRVPRGTSAADLIEQSNVMQEVDVLRALSIEGIKLGVFAEPVRSDYMLQDGDRVEIYRALKADPKEVRRQLALIGKTIGKTGRTD